MIGQEKGGGGGVGAQRSQEELKRGQRTRMVSDVFLSVLIRLEILA